MSGRKKAESKTDIVFAVLAGGIYRRWWWANFKTSAAQSALRELWAPVLARLEPWQIRQGLAKWADERGENDPPTPEAFAAFVRPVHTPSSRRGFSEIRAILEG